MWARPVLETKTMRVAMLRMTRFPLDMNWNLAALVTTTRVGQQLLLSPRIGISSSRASKKGTTMFGKKTSSLLIALAAIVAGTGAASANSIEIEGVTTTFNGSSWDYAYNMSLTANNSVSATNPNGSSQFIFYDLTGMTGASFTSGTTPSSSWQIFQENTSGAWANNVSSIVSQGGTAVEPDLPNLVNVRFQYVGPDFSAGANNSAIGTAHLLSTQAPGLFGNFAARWVDANSRTQVNTQSPQMPVPPAGASVPLPSAVWMGLSSLAGLAVVARARRRSQA
jgi:hypothetical protein